MFFSSVAKGAIFTFIVRNSQFVQQANQNPNAGKKKEKKRKNKISIF